jgi:hypothetical protein
MYQSYAIVLGMKRSSRVPDVEIMGGIVSTYGRFVQPHVRVILFGRILRQGDPH